MNAFLRNKFLHTARHATISTFVIRRQRYSASLQPAQLTCDSLVTPLGIDDPRPRLSWQLRDPSFGARQSAYQIQIATKPSRLTQDKPDIWDSGKIASDRSVGVPYAGPALTAEKRYYWRVKVPAELANTRLATHLVGNGPDVGRKLAGKMDWLRTGRGAPHPQEIERVWDAAGDEG